MPWPVTADQLAAVSAGEQLPPGATAWRKRPHDARKQALKARCHDVSSHLFRNTFVDGCPSAGYNVDMHGSGCPWDDAEGCRKQRMACRPPVLSG